MNAEELSAIFPRQYWLGEAEVPYLFRKAGCTDGLIVEIGTAYGGSAALFLLGKRPGVRVVSVDPFVEDPHTHFRASERECRAAVRQAAGEALCGGWTLLARASAEVAAGWATPIGLLFVDGDHRYEAVRQDVELWMPHVGKEGTIILHDARRLAHANPRVYARGWPGPTQVVEELVHSRAYEIRSTCYSLVELGRTP